MLLSKIFNSITIEDVAVGLVVYDYVKNKDQKTAENYQIEPTKYSTHLSRVDEENLKKFEKNDNKHQL